MGVRHCEYLDGCQNRPRREETKVAELAHDLIMELGGLPLTIVDAVATVAPFIDEVTPEAVILAADGARIVGVCTLTCSNHNN